MSDREDRTNDLLAEFEGILDRGDYSIDSIVDALGAIWMTHPDCILDEDGIRDLCEALRHDLKEGREGEEWKEQPHD